MGIKAEWTPRLQDKVAKGLREKAKLASGLRLNRPWSEYEAEGKAIGAVEGTHPPQHS